MRVLPVLAAAAVAGTAGCGKLGGGCTLIGCTDQVSISLQRADGARPGLAVSLEMEGRTVDCPSPVGDSTIGCAIDVRISSREMVSCVEEITSGARILRCTGTGRFEEIVSIVGTPSTIHAIARTDDAVAADRTFLPTYRDVQPNGPDCEPTCRQWDEVWTLP